MIKSYFDTEWIGKYPDNWKLVGMTKYIDTLVDYRGKTPKKTDEGIFLVTAKNIKNGKIDYEISKEYIAIDDYPTVMSRGLPKLSDVLFTTEAPLGEVANVDREDIALAQRVIKFRGKKDVLDNYFFKYWVLSKGFNQNLLSLATGSTALGIKASKLYNLRLLLPPLYIQKLIVDFLNSKIMEVDILIVIKEKQIKLLEEQRQAMITEAVTKGLNPNVKMKNSGVDWIGEIPEHWEISKIKNKFTINKRVNCIDNPVVFSMTQRGIKEKNIEDYSGQHAESYSKYQQVLKNDFVMNGMDLLTGYIDISNYKYGVTSPDYRVFTLNNSKDLAEYFLMYFQMCYKQKIFYGLGQGVSKLGRWRLQTKTFKNFPIMVPPKEEQIEIIETIKCSNDDIVLGIDLIKIQISKMKEYRQSLIHEAVTGKIPIEEMESYLKEAEKNGD
ncbi:restriction endonuclease subunit S [Enterococcus sp. BWR-S5]|uniref:restriction endonuclease subunit S n=1 Tax=Enterococcus sp. BWR-S5 TaxID=2787714 RepID=UPI001922DFF3|nr:restriction endonuclease subunit S [Enterococcus sp. BWR-S5]MBL1226560.1 restriction endonuclease subunit S [Enterococcus sp. BWR-S5]